MNVTAAKGVSDEQAAWTVDLYVTCTPGSSPVAPLIYVTDNGKAMPGSPVTPGTGEAARFGACFALGTGYEAPAEIAFKPTTRGPHHIVATQYKPDGSVLSTMSRDVTLPADSALPCTVGAGSAMTDIFCYLPSGSAS
ncbi:hypothetical protein ACFRAQ_16695 [Nocardia sp. NPDC056611]|uniref:hypothetical protein n=1 Tax=Nocardia sp. NPDC056611 TaxID=3345877 RepID=UPI00366DC758